MDGSNSIVNVEDLVESWIITEVMMDVTSAENIMTSTLNDKQIGEKLIEIFKADLNMLFLLTKSPR